MKIHAIINGISPRATRQPVQATLRRRLGEHRLSLEQTEYAGHGVVLARVAVEDKADIVVAIGGDGTVNEVLNGIIGTGTRLAVIPAGTANDLAGHFGLPRNVDQACDLILAGHETTIDTVRVNGWHYCTTGGLGLPSGSLDRVRRLRQGAGIGGWLTARLRSRIYLYGLLTTLIARRERGQIVIDTGTDRLKVDPLSLTLSNLPRLGRHFHPAPEARPDNGLVDLCLIENRGRRRALAISMRVARGRHRSGPEVRLIRTERVTIHCDRPLQFFGDGELRPATTEFDITVQPRSLRLLTPDRTEVA